MQLGGRNNTRERAGRGDPPAVHLYLWRDPPYTGHGPPGSARTAGREPSECRGKSLQAAQSGGTRRLGGTPATQCHIDLMSCLVLAAQTGNSEPPAFAVCTAVEKCTD